jgi:hypothetical protein
MGFGVFDFLRMNQEQKGLCKICRNPETSIDKSSGKIKSLAIDHCHQTNRIRGLLCSNCNRALGLFRDSPAILQKAIDYLVVQ